LVLEAEIFKLRQQIEEVRCQQGRQAGRFRRRKTKKRRRKSGRPVGHAAALRPTPTPEQVDRVIDVPCRECPDCHVPLVDPGQVVQYQTDLPPIVPVVTQFNIETGFCPCCRQRCQGRHAEQTSNATGAAANTFGPVVLTMAAELKHRLGVPYRKICDFLQTYCGLKVCPATFVRAEQRLTERARPTYELLLDALRQAHVVHADETGWRIGKVNAWLWVFSSKDVTIYAIRRSRGHDVPEDILGVDFDGYLIVDGLQTYDVLDYAKGRCNAHILRRVNDLMDSVPASEQKHLKILSRLLKKAIALAQRREEFTTPSYARRVQAIEDRLDDWLEANNRRSTLSAELQRLDMHLRKHRGEWLVFLHDPEVPPTNNHAERMLRPAVITRKVGGCNKSLWGAMVHSILSSIMVTCHRQGQRFLDLARQLWRANQPQALRLANLTP
jgi:transposase